MTLGNLSDSDIFDILQVYEFKADTFFLNGMRKYIELLDRWNRRISLTTIASPEEIVRRHFGESLFALRLQELSNGLLADVGSGAGFPALVLKLASPGLTIRLYEANKRKCAFLHEVVREIALEHVEVAARHTSEGDAVPFADYATARAVGDHEQLLRWAKRSLVPKGTLILWLGREDATKLSKVARWTWREAVPIPESKSRVVLIGQVTP